MGDALDLSVAIGPVRLKNPFIVGSGPTVRDLDQIKSASENGWAAATLKLAMDPVPYINHPPRYRWLRKQRYHTFTAEKRLTPDTSLAVIERARKVVPDFVIIPNLTYAGADLEGWGRLARRFEAAGAPLLELNMCCPNMSFNVTTTGERAEQSTGASLGSNPALLKQVVRMTVDAVSVPVIVKLTPEGGRIAQAAAACFEAGATAVGGTANRLGIPDFDIHDPGGTIYRLQDGLTLGCLSGPWLRPLALRDTYEMRRALAKDAVVIASGGISDLQSAVQQIMAGADALWVCTETMLRGFGWLPELLADFQTYMKDMGYHSLADLRDVLHSNIFTAGELKTHDGHAVVNPDKCTACGQCWRIGHCPAISHPDGTTLIDADSCLACSTCVDVCPRQAISMVRR